MRNSSTSWPGDGLSRSRKYQEFVRIISRIRQEYYKNLPIIFQEFCPIIWDQTLYLRSVVTKTFKYFFASKAPWPWECLQTNLAFEMAFIYYMCFYPGVSFCAIIYSHGTLQSSSVMNLLSRLIFSELPFLLRMINRNKGLFAFLNIIWNIQLII